MYLDDAGHVQHSGLTQYCDFSGALAWFEKFGAGVPEACRATLVRWVNMKAKYARDCAAGKIAFIIRTNGVETGREVVKPSDADVAALSRFETEYKGAIAA